MVEVTMVSSRAAVVGQFEPIETFEAPETRSTYVAGHRYYIREGNDLLAMLVTRWVAEGKVRRV